MVVVWALDRLARSLKHLLTIAEECRTLGVDIVCLKQNIDTTLPAGRLTFQVLGAVADFEREMLRERVRAGMVHARPTGKRIGRPALRHFGRGDIEQVQLLRTQGADDAQVVLARDRQYVSDGGGAQTQITLDQLIGRIPSQKAKKS